MAIGKLSSNGMITIPAEIREKYGIRPGDRVSILQTQDGIFLVPIMSLDDLVDENTRATADVICRELIEEHRKERADIA